MANFSATLGLLDGTGLSYIFRWDLILELILVFTLTWLIKVHQSQKGKAAERKSTQRKIDGPKSLPLIGVLHKISWPGADAFQVITNWCLEYGKIFQAKLLLTRFYIVSDPEYVKKALESADPNHLNKPRKLYDIVAAEIVTEGLLFSDYPTWIHNRKIISRGFSYRGIQYQVGNTNLHMKRMISNLLRQYEDDTSRDLGETGFCKLLNNTSLDIILHSIMDLEITTAKERAEFHNELIISKNGVSKRIRQPWLLFKPIYWLHPLRLELKRSHAEIIKFVQNIIQRYKTRHIQNRENFGTEEENEFKPFKSIVEEMMDENFTDDHIVQECVFLIYAGHETTSWSIIFLLLRLALNPEIQERCRKEVDQLFESKLGHSKNSLELELTKADLANLEYLDMCMKENLRLTPVGPIFSRRLDAPLYLEDDLILEKGRNLVISPWAIHRNPENYPDPEKFDPDRFLPQATKERHPYSYIPFSGGMRNCIGYKMAPLTIKLVVAWILRHFVVESRDKWEDLEFVFDVTLTTKNDVNFSLKKRPNIE